MINAWIAVIRARPMYWHTDIHRTMLPMYRIGKIPPIYISKICS